MGLMIMMMMIGVYLMEPIEEFLVRVWAGVIENETALRVCARELTICFKLENERLFIRESIYTVFFLVTFLLGTGRGVISNATKPERVRLYVKENIH
jgi:hypothetical protein